MPSALPPGEPAPADGALPAAALEGMASRPFSVYLHVPFCRVRCGYCDFNTYTLDELGGGQTGEFVRAAHAELDVAAQAESWRTATALAGTLRDAELLDDALPPDRLLYRLFHTEGVAADRPRALAYGCRCSRARLSGVLEGFSTDDLDHMAVNGDIIMTCEFCNLDFHFGRGEIGTARDG